MIFDKCYNKNYKKLFGRNSQVMAILIGQCGILFSKWPMAVKLYFYSYICMYLHIYSFSHLQSPWLLVLDTYCCYQNRCNTGWIHLYNIGGDSSPLEPFVLYYIIYSLYDMAVIELLVVVLSIWMYWSVLFFIRKV